MASSPWARKPPGRPAVVVVVVVVAAAWCAGTGPSGARAWHRRRAVRRVRRGVETACAGRLVRVQPGHDQDDDEHGHHADGGQRGAQPARPVVDDVHASRPRRRKDGCARAGPRPPRGACAPASSNLTGSPGVGTGGGRDRGDGRPARVGQANGRRARDPERAGRDRPPRAVPFSPSSAMVSSPPGGSGSPRGCAAGGGSARPSGRRRASAAGRPRRQQRGPRPRSADPTDQHRSYSTDRQADEHRLRIQQDSPVRISTGGSRRGLSTARPARARRRGAQATPPQRMSSGMSARRGLP